MTTNNLKKIINAMFNDTKIEVNNHMVGTDGQLITNDYDEFYIVPYLKKTRQIINTNESDNTGVGVFTAFGSGSSVESSLDYKLESELDTLTLINNTTNIVSGAFVITSTVKNSTDEDILISELSTFMNSMRTIMNDPYYSKTFMLTRNVLETPITIKPGETKTFTITINF